MEQIILVVFLIGIFLLLGLVIMGIGLYTLLRGLPISQTQLQKDLISWQVLGPNTLPQTLTDVQRSWSYFNSMSMLAGGISIVLSMIGWAIFTLMSARTAASMNNFSGSIFSASVFLSLGIGVGIGAVVAAWRLRNTARRSITYAGLRQRRLSDYRSNAFFWLAVAMIVWTFGVLLFFAPHVGSTLPINLFYVIVSVPTTGSGLVIIPGAMLLMLALVEITLFRIVSFSRLLVTSDTTVSQRADDMLRATIIGRVQYCELIALGYLTSLVYTVLLPSLMASHYWQIGQRPYEGFLASCLFMPSAMQFVGLGILLMRGHLGGKLSRWPWQTRHIKQLVGEQ